MNLVTRRAALAGLACTVLPGRVVAAPRRTAADWPTGSAAGAGVDARLLSAAADQVGGSGERQGLVIVQDGRLIFERYWESAFFRADPRWRNVSFSSGKSWGSAMVGRAITQGRLGLDDLAERYVPVERTGLLPGTTIRHLLTMTSGGSLVTKPSSRLPQRLGEPVKPAPPAEYRRSMGQSEEPNAPEGYGVSMIPGSTFFYDGAPADHLAEIISAATGTASYDYMMKEIVRPLGCRDFDYQLEGIDRNRDIRIGGSITLSCRDMARLGQLFLDGGRWNGRQLIDASYTQAATSPSQRNSEYGFLWWLNTKSRIAAAPRSMYFAAGAFGQFCFVVPERRLVVASMGFGKPRPNGDAIWGPLAPVLLA